MRSFRFAFFLFAFIAPSQHVSALLTPALSGVCRRGHDLSPLTLRVQENKDINFVETEAKVDGKVIEDHNLNGVHSSASEDESDEDDADNIDLLDEDEPSDPAMEELDSDEVDDDVDVEFMKDAIDMANSV